MPIYEYRCRQCGAVFEALQPLGADGSELTCPKCGAPQPEKIFSAFASSGHDGGGAGARSSCGTGGFT
ncbi:zinc ribbon domain-containing protein [candidate division KSB1 bacterium]|nr:zinc ribbon domain-containing protein [candidate division KSB1 bacterium]